MTNVLHESEEDWVAVKQQMKKDGTLEKLPLEKQYVKSPKRLASERAAVSREAAVHRQEGSRGRREAANAFAASDAILAAYKGHATPYKDIKKDYNRSNVNKPEVVKVVKVKVPRVDVKCDKLAKSSVSLSDGESRVVCGAKQHLPSAHVLQPAAASSELLTAASFSPPRVEGVQVANARAEAAKLTNRPTLSQVTLRSVEGLVKAMTHDVGSSPPPLPPPTPPPPYSPANNVIII